MTYSALNGFICIEGFQNERQKYLFFKKTAVMPELSQNLRHLPVQKVAGFYGVILRENPEKRAIQSIEHTWKLHATFEVFVKNLKAQPIQ